MRRRNIVPAAILAVLLLACLAAVYVTREPGKAVAVPQTGTTNDPAAGVDSQRSQEPRLAMVSQT